MADNSIPPVAPPLCNCPKTPAGAVVVPTVTARKSAGENPAGNTVEIAVP